MKPLFNTVERKKLMERVKNEPFQRKVFSFYRYVHIDEPQTLRDQLYKTWHPLSVLGRIYVASEGINAQMSVPEAMWNDFLETFSLFPALQHISINDAVEPKPHAFFKLDIRARKRIVVDGLEENIFETSSIGKHLSSTEFHEMVGQKDVVVVDARNGYECVIGHFENAVTPTSKTFSKVLPELREKLSPYKNKKILMYCTGGIRCEKASAYLKREGFEDVYQLRGGIIRYINEMKKTSATPKYKGSVYVFDERMAESTESEKLGSCDNCGTRHSSHANCGNIHCHRLMIQCPACSKKFNDCCSNECMKKRDALTPQ